MAVQDSSAEPWEPRLGSLQTLLAVAKHLDFEAAAKELDVTERNVRRTIHQLELWFRRVVVHRGKVLILTSDGRYVCRVVAEALSPFDQYFMRSAVTPFQRNQPKLANIRLSDIRCILDVLEHRNYWLMRGPGESPVKVKATVLRVQQALGITLFSGGPAPEATALSSEFFEDAKEFIGLLLAARMTELEFTSRLSAAIREARLDMKTNILVWNQREKRRKLEPVANRSRRENIEKLAQFESMQRQCDRRLAEKFGIPTFNINTTSAAHIDMDASYKEQNARSGSGIASEQCQEGD